MLEETTYQSRPTGRGRADLGEDEHVPVQEREECDTRTAVAAPDSEDDVRKQSAHERIRCHRGMLEAGRSMPHNNECRMRIRARMEKNEDGREGLKKEEQRQGRHPEKAVARSVEEDPALRRAAEEHKRKLEDIETDDGLRGK